jgi:hypothetical protein
LGVSVDVAVPPSAGGEAAVGGLADGAVTMVPPTGSRLTVVGTGAAVGPGGVIRVVIGADESGAVIGGLGVAEFG